MPSGSQTTLLNEPIQKQSLCVKETKRYERKGYGLCFSILQTFLFFYYMPILGRSLFPEILAWKERNGISQTGFDMIISLVSHQIAPLLLHPLFWFLYHNEFAWIERYKANLEEPWPWYEDATKWSIQVKKAVALTLFNANFIIPVWIFVGQKLLPHVSFQSAPEQIPGPLVFMAQILFCFLMEDLMFYSSHRLLHTPFMYKHVHKVHHQFTISVAIAAEYAHPIEYFLGNVLPSSLGPALLSYHMHYWVLICWGMARTAEALESHSGYEFSFSPFRLMPFAGSAEYHDFHHSRNVGNYGSFMTIWDTIFGTNKPFYDYLAEQDKKIKKD